VLLEGECQLRIGSRLLQLRAGDVVLLPSGAAHRIITPGPVGYGARSRRPGPHSVTPVDTSLWTAVANPRIAQTIESVLAEPGADWSIDRLSRTASMSRATFLRHFGRETGMTVGSFLVRIRMMAAAELLRSGDATVATIADRVGYRSESAFSRAFRAEIGTAPAGFRRARGQPEH